MTRTGALGVVGGLAVAAVAVAALLPPIPQDPAYHRLADARRWLGVPNAANVLSNAGFVLVGALGLAFVIRSPLGEGPVPRPGNRWPYAVFFGGLVLTGIGSAYYHWAPGNPRLAWDRLPLAITIVGLLDAVVAERIGPRVALRLLGPLVVLAALSVGYWAWTEQGGAGDLRAYAVVQFFPLLAIPLMLWWLPSPQGGGAGLLAAAAIYALAKVAERMDAWIFSVTRVVSGHTLKHLLAAGAGFAVLMMLERRRAVVTRTP
ncbi:MAG TPA: alkaline phytoceramidase [Methylomirabilota bacterium]|nr:alkaline phytoceramidase [Methylomirabilota bacterium]